MDREDRNQEVVGTVRVEKSSAKYRSPNESQSYTVTMYRDEEGFEWLECSCRKRRHISRSCFHILRSIPIFFDARRI